MYSSTNPLISNTQINIYLYDEPMYLKIDNSRISKFPDSYSLKFGDDIDGVKFCGLDRTAVVIDEKG
jgi:hypothetical protein